MYPRRGGGEFLKKRGGEPQKVRRLQSYLKDSFKIKNTLGSVLAYCLTLADTPGRIALLELSPRFIILAYIKSLGQINGTFKKGLVMPSLLKAKYLCYPKQRLKVKSSTNYKVLIGLPERGDRVKNLILEKSILQGSQVTYEDNLHLSCLINLTPDLWSCM